MDSSARDEGTDETTSPSEGEVDLSEAEGFPLRASDRPLEELPTADPLTQPGNQLPVEPAEPGDVAAGDRDDEAVEGVSDGPAWPKDTPPEVRSQAERMAAQNLANAEAMMAAPAQQSAEPAEPGIYYCDAEDPGVHPQLGRLVHGENDFTGVTHPEALQALGELVAAGTLKKA